MKAQFIFTAIAALGVATVMAAPVDANSVEINERDIIMEPEHPIYQRSAEPEAEPEAFAEPEALPEPEAEPGLIGAAIHGIKGLVHLIHHKHHH